MSQPRPTSEPQFFTAGDSLQFDKSIPGYSAADGWALSYVLTKLGRPPIPITGAVITSTGSVFNVNVPAATTAVWPPDTYAWTAQVTGSGANAGQRFTVLTGNILIKPNPATADANTDLRTDAKRNLDALDAVIAGKVTSDIQMYKINNREITKMPWLELLKARNYWEARVKQERIAAGEKFPSTTVGAFFGPVT